MEKGQGVFRILKIVPMVEEGLLCVLLLLHMRSEVCACAVCSACLAQTWALAGLDKS